MMLNWKYAIWTDEGKTFGPSGKESDCIQILGLMDDGRTIDEAINILFDEESIYNCGHKTTSSFGLPFFKYNMDSEYDAYYCGCFGWD